MGSGLKDSEYNQSVCFRKKESEVSGAIWDTLPVTEKEKDEICFQKLRSSVKINQFPGLFSIGRKDSLWRGYTEMRQTWGSRQFDFHSRTFILPEDREELETAMAGQDKAFIMKPPNWYCGIGIKMIHRLGNTHSLYLVWPSTLLEHLCQGIFPARRRSAR